MRTFADMIYVSKSSLQRWACYDYGLTSDERAQAKFGVRGLGIVAVVVGVAIVLFILLSIIV